MIKMKSGCAWVLTWLMVAFNVSVAATEQAPASYLSRLPEDEIIYFLLPDRFENGDPANDRGARQGNRRVTGFDAADAGFYHGGDLRGVASRLDYIQALGATAIWIAPVFTNDTVEGDVGHESAGYHGYWITDFTRVDPHFGTNEDFRQLVDSAHARGMKVYLDIVVNHTADVISYRECAHNNCPYRSSAEFPYTRRGGLSGAHINEGFLGDAPPFQTEENFLKLTRPDYAYTPFVPRGKEHLKVPDWLNDPIYYHNRGNSTFEGESALLGDFSGLDDLMTEQPQVVRGFIDIYGRWIDEYGIDGYRIDTAKHVNPEFWRQFVPAMLMRAKARGIRHFHIFGEVQTSDFDPALLARQTRVSGLPAVLDFGFANAVRDTVAGSTGTYRLAELFADDALYEAGAVTARQLPTFLSNHDDGRFAYKARRARPAASDAEVLKRVALGYAMLLTMRGVPVVYYGDEQGFAGTGGDRAARQDMFPSKTPAYLADRTLDPHPAPGQGHFNPHHPLYQLIAELSKLRHDTPALRRGEQIVRFASSTPGLFAVSRLDAASGAEVLLVFNTSMQALAAQLDIDPRSEHFSALHGPCNAARSAPGTYAVRVAALDYLICSSNDPR